MLKHGAPHLKRRHFITLLGAAVAWPLAARAQQPQRMRRIGVLMPLTADDAIAQSRNGAFLQGLQQLGWAVGQNVEIEYRWSGGTDEVTRRHAGLRRRFAADRRRSEPSCDRSGHGADTAERVLITIVPYLSRS